MSTDDPKIAKAVDLLQQHEKTKQACLDFLKDEGASGYDPIALKLWIADRLVAPQPSVESIST